MRKLLIFFLIITGLVQMVYAQRNPLSRFGGFSNMGGGQANAGGKDSLTFEKRNFADDTAAIRYRYLDSARYRALDSSISDFFDRTPMKPEYVN
ncbi:MAG: hypothetical protein ACK43L_07450, partial [Sphingobacteriales bacterium]